ncbi:MAG: hypothetical protein RLZZ182_2309, partial [Pseudomonadota bacterium]
ITEGKGLNIGYFAQQELDVLRPDEGPLAHMVRLAKAVNPQAREQELRDFLGRFRFTGDMVMQPVGQFSGGEKARLVLALIVWQRPNLLLLDEPTNHLDLTTREALSMALNEFEGSVMLVSHDRALLREVCDEFWLVAQGKVEPFDGDLDDYQRWLIEQSRQQAAALKAQQQAAAQASASADSPANRKEDRKAAAQARQKLQEQARPLKAEIKKIDDRLAALSTERDAINERLCAADLGADERTEKSRRLKIVGDEIDELEMRWLELSEALEALQSAG